MMYGKTVIWLTDKLIFNRIEAGELYKGLTKAVKPFPDVDYVNLAKAINWVVFDRHETGIRNSASENELKELRDLELNLAYVINSGLIRSFVDLIAHLRFLYNKKYQRSIL